MVEEADNVPLGEPLVGVQGYVVRTDASEFVVNFSGERSHELVLCQGILIPIVVTFPQQPGSRFDCITTWRVCFATNHFTLVRIMLLDEGGQSCFKHPLWLLVVGERRHELSLEDLYQAYTQPSDLEHFFRFGNQRLLLASYQTPEVGR